MRETPVVKQKQMKTSLNRLKRKRLKPSPEIMISWGSILALVLIWYSITKMNVLPKVFFPSPYETFLAFQEMVREGYKGHTLLYHLSDSLLRMFTAFFLAAITAVPLGLVSGYSSKIGAVLDPIIEFYRALPPLAYYTLLILWFGIDNESKIALLYLAAFPPMYIASMAGVKGVSKDRMHSAQCLGANKRQVFTHIIFPSCLPEIFTGVRTATSAAYTTLVAAEMVAATSGLGWLVLDASKYLRSDIMFVGIIILGITGVLLDKLIRLAENKFVPWKGKEV